MAGAFNLGNTVKLVTITPSGPVLEKRLMGDDIEYLVQWEDADGDLHQRWFREDQLEAVQE
jgi:hypothetical protein